MKTKIFGIGLVALLLVLSMGVSAKKIQEGVMVDGKFQIVNNRAFEASEDVWVRGVGKFNDDVTVYVSTNRAWACGDNVKDIKGVKSFTGAISNKQALKLGTFPANKIYDVFVDEDKDGIVDCCIGGGCGKQTSCVGASECNDCDDDCVKEIVDGKSFRCFAFEVLPELATSLLLGAGLLSMVGYFAIAKR